ncbi:MAG: hypothetical protein NT011_12560 [Kiritimatiellaeota bacterium]|nr:hypothetical protein [Kiritimatiellota bacterium]
MSIQQISKNDKAVLRELGRKYAEIAANPVNQTRQKLWKRLNNIERVKPPVCIYEIPWCEMNVNDELTVRTQDPLCGALEQNLRMTIYRWDHMPGDMVVEPVICAPVALTDSGFGIEEDVDVTKTDEKNDVVSRHFNIQIKEEADAEKIKMPVITHDVKKSAEILEFVADIFKGIIRVKRGGVKEFSFNAWDELVRWTGVQEVLMDMAIRPEYVHVLMRRLTRAYLARLDQYDALGLILQNNDNSYSTSGGLGYTEALPKLDSDKKTVHPMDCWGRSMSQIFSEVSPEMHDEFALQYEMEWLKRFGVTYYGCCEPLHKKVGILKKVPNLRKISMSPWINFNEAVANIGRNYVFSFKPNPALLAVDTWNPENVRKYLAEKLEITKSCVVEIILKDISTVRHQPERLWEWARIAAEVSAQYA